MARVSISLPKELLEEFDKIIRLHGYDRSKAVQVSMRNFLSEHRWAHMPKEKGVGALLILYDRSQRGLEEALTEVQHHFEGIISSSMHIHLDEESCLEIIAVKGLVQEIQELHKALSGKKGVKQVRLAITAPR